MCTGCREHKPKTELVRVVKSPAGEISMDLTGRKPGRGAYICRQASCLRKAQKSKALQRALDTEISDEVFEQLVARVEEGANEG